MTNKLEELVLSYPKPLMAITTDLGHRYLGEIRYNNGEIFKGTKETVVDKETLRLLEVDQLFGAVNHTQTLIGAGTLYRSLVQPLDNLEIILARQEALRELEGNPQLRNALEDILAEVAKREERFFDFVNGRFAPINAVSSYTDAKRFIRRVVSKAKQLPTPDSLYLRTLVQDLRNFESTNTFALVKGPVYQTFRGIKSKNEVGFFTPAIKFSEYMYTPSLTYKPLLVAGYVFGVYKAVEYGVNSPENAIIIPVTIFSIFPLIFASMHFDNKVFCIPLYNYLRTDPAVHQLVDSIGKLDEMMSLYRYAKAMPTQMVLPAVTDAEHHYFVASNVKNPIKAKTNPRYVPNGVNLNGTYITFVTGPNSGGKTDYCMTIGQTQILAQIGSFIAADEAEISIADRIFYQAPQFSEFQDEEGRFGREIKRTKGIFYKTTPGTLIIFDELLEGTRHEEKLRESYDLLKDFTFFRNNVVLVTHNDDLVDRFRANGIGTYIQVEFRDGNPTYRLIPGISRDSHADRVMRKIGFTPEERRQHLAKEGHIPPLNK